MQTCLREGPMQAHASALPCTCPHAYRTPCFLQTGPSQLLLLPALHVPRARLSLASQQCWQCSLATVTSLALARMHRRRQTTATCSGRTSAVLRRKCAPTSSSAPDRRTVLVARATGKTQDCKGKFFGMLVQFQSCASLDMDCLDHQPVRVRVCVRARVCVCDIVHYSACQHIHRNYVRSGKH